MLAYVGSVTMLCLGGALLAAEWCLSVCLSVTMLCLGGALLAAEWCLSVCLSVCYNAVSRWSASGCRVMSACHCWQLLATTQLSGTHVFCWLLDCRCDDCLSNSSFADFISLTFLFTPTDLLVTTPPSGTTVQRIQFQSHWLHVFVDSDPLICWLWVPPSPKRHSPHWLYWISLLWSMIGWVNAWRMEYRV